MSKKPPEEKELTIELKLNGKSLIESIKPLLTKFIKEEIRRQLKNR